ncbi:hypothetical protein M9458_018149, partial [Cirrhinus mrigala]
MTATAPAAAPSLPSTAAPVHAPAATYQHGPTAVPAAATAPFAAPALAAATITQSKGAQNHSLAAKEGRRGSCSSQIT